MSEIAERLKNVEHRIEEARQRSLYHQPVTLVAVTKFHPVEDMEEAIRLGVTDVGENRVQEMEAKKKVLTLPVHWHLQGHLQKNKVKKAVEMADLIQSADSLEILKEIDKRAGQIGKKQPVLLEFNISGEEQKHGFSPDLLKETARAALELPNIKVLGLMCMAPKTEHPEETRPVFHKARDMWTSMQNMFPQGQISILSMGMTQDFEIAIEEGATMVRVGTAIFGPRN
jgi:pyridoxal phosphate enzyme (YggS family)